MGNAEINAARAAFDRTHRVTLEAISRLDDVDLDYRPQAGMRSPRELVFHIYGVARGLAEAVRDGTLTDDADEAYTPEKTTGAAEVAKLRTRDDLSRFAETCHHAASDALAGLDDDALRQPIPSRYGEFTGSQLIGFIHDEHWHHRGQLYTYLRLLGKEPPSLYGSSD